MTDLEGLASLVISVLYPELTYRMKGSWAAAGQRDAATDMIVRASWQAMLGHILNEEGTE